MARADHGRDQRRRAGFAGGARGDIRRRLATSGLAQGAAAAILPAAMLMGFAFPIALRAVDAAARPVRRDPARGRHGSTPRTWSAASPGRCSAGSCCCRWLGSRRALIALAALYLAASVALLAATRAGSPPSPWSSSSCWPRGSCPIRSTRRWPAATAANERIFWREEGVQTSVSIHTDAFSGWLMYSTGCTRPRTRPKWCGCTASIGHLPMVLHPSPRRRAGGRPGRRRDARRRQPARHRRAGRRALGQRPQGRRVLRARQLRPAQPPERAACASTTAATSCRSPASASTSSPPTSSSRFTPAPATSTRASTSRSCATRVADDGLALQWIGHRLRGAVQADHAHLPRRVPVHHAVARRPADGGHRCSRCRISPARVRPPSAPRPETRAALDEIGLDSFETLASLVHRPGPTSCGASSARAPVLTDDRPLVEYHRSLPGRTTRRSTWPGSRGDVPGR